MPKINVYLPDELADRVKAAGVPVSAICQRALEQSVRRVTAIRATVLGDLETEDPTAQLSQFTTRLRAAIRLAIERARANGAAAVGTEHLLHGMLTEQANLGVRVLRANEIEPAHVTRALDDATPASGKRSAKNAATEFSGPAANALELALTEALSLGHNYVGCEHLLLGLIGEPDGTAGAVLRESGIDLRSARRMVVAALTGYVQHRPKPDAAPGQDPAAMIAAVVREELRPVLDRVERLEQRSEGA